MKYTAVLNAYREELPSQELYLEYPDEESEEPEELGRIADMEGMGLYDILSGH
jgi:hypothetical protein